MRKLILIIFLFLVGQTFLSVDNYSQQLYIGTGKSIGNTTSGMSLNVGWFLSVPSLNIFSSQQKNWSVEAKAYFDRMTNKPANDTLTWIAEFIDSLVANGIWAKRDEIWLHANNNISNAMLGLKGYKNCTDSGTIFVAYRGIKSNGTSTFANTHYNPVTDGIHYTLNSCGFSIYINSYGIKQYYQFGAQASSGYTILYITPTTTYYTNNISASHQSIANTTTRGFIFSDRTSAFVTTLYVNGSPLTPSSTAAAIMPNLNFYICCMNNSGTASIFDDSRIAYTDVGGSLTPQDNTNYYSCLYRLLTHLGAN